MFVIKEVYLSDVWDKNHTNKKVELDKNFQVYKKV